MKKRNKLIKETDMCLKEIYLIDKLERGKRERYIYIYVYTSASNAGNYCKQNQ